MKSITNQSRTTKSKTQVNENLKDLPMLDLQAKLESSPGGLSQDKANLEVWQGSASKVTDYSSSFAQGYYPTLTISFLNYSLETVSIASLSTSLPDPSVLPFSDKIRFHDRLFCWPLNN